MTLEINLCAPALSGASTEIDEDYVVGEVSTATIYSPPTCTDDNCLCNISYTIALDSAGS